MSVSSLHLPIAIATRPQFGSAPCTAVFTSGELTIVLATRFAWASSRAPVTVTSISVWAPSPSRAICFVRSRHTDCIAASSASTATGPAAPLASHDGGVTRGRVGVDADAVERAVDHPPEDADRDRRVPPRASVSTIGDHRGHVGLDHPHALREPDDTRGRAVDVGTGHLGVGVGRHDARGRRVGRVAGCVARDALDAGADALHRIPTSDHPGRGDEHVGRVAAQPRRRRRRRVRRRRNGPSGPFATFAFFDTTTIA